MINTKPEKPADVFKKYFNDFNVEAYIDVLTNIGRIAAETTRKVAELKHENKFDVLNNDELFELFNEPTDKISKYDYDLLNILSQPFIEEAKILDYYTYLLEHLEDSPE